MKFVIKESKGAQISGLGRVADIPQLRFVESMLKIRKRLKIEGINYIPIEHEQATMVARQDDDVIFSVRRPLADETDIPTLRLIECL